MLQLLRFLDDVSQSCDEGNECHVVYTDIEKAFDRVPHGRLLKVADISCRRENIVVDSVLPSQQIF